MLDVGDNLYYKSGEMEQYKGFVVSEIDPITGVVTFTNGDTIRKGDVTGDVSENDMRRVQIHETILSHFEKEQELFKLGIKTLSLFFIDEVAKYRQYDEDGNELLGEYGKIFEQEYLSVLNEHRTLFDPAYTAYLDSTDVHDVQDVYKRQVLVLCPKKLAENWNTYKDNYVNNPIASYRLNYDILFHTDLSRSGGKSNGLDLDLSLIHIYEREILADGCLINYYKH